MSASKIEWTDEVWNPVRGCSRVSEGCRNCYAERQAARFAGPGGRFEGFVNTDAWSPRCWTGKVELIESKLEEPLRWRKPRRVFVNSMSDLFHEALPDEAIARVFAVMALAPRHTFQVLTKRPDRMRAWAKSLSSSWWGQVDNVWLGVSVEDQATADARIPVLLDTPAALRFVSYEPALGPVDFSRWIDMEIKAYGANGTECFPRIDWLIAGGESGPGARPCDVAWIRSVVEQCRFAGVPRFVKQLGANRNDGGRALISAGQARERGGWRHPKGGDPSEWPEDLRVQEFPR